MMLILAGTAIGSAGAIALSRVLSTTIPTLPTRDPVALAALIVFLVVVALVACYVPAGRAARLNPLLALRHH
jgi:ABC-type antimicrobial peptide transport system permease subunit